MSDDEDTPQGALRAAIAILGGVTPAAAKLHVGASALANWAHRGVPAEQCASIEVATGGRVKRKQLRPDIFGSLDDIRAARVGASDRASDCTQ
jgi:DNA-binding transcriptional regulator YdaS (Cro superfamily)